MRTFVLYCFDGCCRHICVVLQTADLHVSKAAIRSMTSTSAHDLLVEMPPGFAVDGDTGSIGRFNAMSGVTNTSLEMEIKGDTGQLLCWKALITAAQIDNSRI